ncbi:transcriptional regulator [Flavilitoribacter nigricans DSM 23189 = NBRC 102662]|uniref:Peptidyl-prolyl cis-trans isomerase n=2 Tax=Flavilitoribacter TaxID=2762562 RepID=A0A2D0N3R4_FLAN2|nr:transcriptional regulator [Flavilitoribacter nigricans DSM 23189 = NBRC 102662]
MLAYLLLVVLVVGCSRPVAQFTYSGEAKAPANIQFENQSEKADSYEWDFGDGKTSEEAAPTHRFRKSGIYDVQLRAFREGKSRVTRQQVVIAPPDRCLVEVETPYGNMLVELFSATPQHQDNFTKLVEDNFFDSLLFHRVIQEFMIQGGDPNSKGAGANQMLGSGGPGYTIPAEFVDSLIHIKGALSAARTGDQVNPEKRSSGSQFYIVQGKTYTDRELDIIESRKNMRYTSAQRELYKTVGGTPFLDRDYTVFGQVIEGLEVIDAIAAQPTDGRDRPRENVWMKMTFIK